MKPWLRIAHHAVAVFGQVMVILTFQIKVLIIQRLIPQKSETYQSFLFWGSISVRMRRPKVMISKSFSAFSFSLCSFSLSGHQSLTLTYSYVATKRKRTREKNHFVDTLSSYACTAVSSYFLSFSVIGGAAWGHVNEVVAWAFSFLYSRTK